VSACFARAALACFDVQQDVNTAEGPLAMRSILVQVTCDL